MKPARNLVLIGMVVFAGACGSLEPRASSVHSGQSTPTDARSPIQTARCDESIPFEPTYLPEGFTKEPFNGPADRARPPDTRGQVIVHYRGPGSTAVEIRRPGTLFTELAQADDAPTINVLGSETSAFGPIEPFGSDFIVSFTLPLESSSEDDCALYSLNEYGVPLAELMRVAKGLRMSSSTTIALAARPPNISSHVTRTCFPPAALPPRSRPLASASPEPSRD